MRKLVTGVSRLLEDHTVIIRTEDKHAIYTRYGLSWWLCSFWKGVIVRCFRTQRLPKGGGAADHLSARLRLRRLILRA